MNSTEWRNRLPRDPFPSINVGNEKGKSPKKNFTAFDPEKHGYKGTLQGRTSGYRQSEKQ